MLQRLYDLADEWIMSFISDVVQPTPAYEELVVLDDALEEVKSLLDGKKIVWITLDDKEYFIKSWYDMEHLSVKLGKNRFVEFQVLKVM